MKPRDILPLNAPTQPRRAWFGSWAWQLTSIALALFLAGCTSVRLISEYDEETDRGVTEFQKSVETFLVSLERKGRAEGPLTDAETAFFEKAAVDLSALSLRAAAIPRNELTVKMIANLGESMGDLEQLVVLGITKDQIKLVRSALNISTGAIIQLELAKKRGETK